MRTFLLVTAAILYSWGFLPAETSASTTSLELKILVQGDTARLPDFVESLRREFSQRGLTAGSAELFCNSAARNGRSTEKAADLETKSALPCSGCRPNGGSWW
jgi:hypothetical protein